MAARPTGEPAATASAAGSPPAEHKPYVPDSADLPEFTLGPVLLGSLLGIVFGASSLYLVLKVGLTVSASIPVAVLSITLFRGFAKVFRLRAATILENNIVQTTGSAGESIAFGVGVTMPALMILGFEMDVGRVIVVAVLGGLLGILMMIPLRRAFIVHQHGKLAGDRRHLTCARRADRRRGRRRDGQDRVQRLRAGVRLQVPDVGPEPLDGGAEPRDLVVQGGRARGRGRSGIAGRWLHHRHAHELPNGGRRRDGLARARPGHPLLRRCAADAADAGQDPDQHDGRQGSPRQLRALYRRRSSGCGRRVQLASGAAADFWVVARGRRRTEARTKSNHRCNRPTSHGS